MYLKRFVVVSSSTNSNLQLWNNKLATLVLQLVPPQSNNNTTWCIRNGHCFHWTLQNFHTTITLSTLDQTSSCISVPPTWPIRTPMTTWRKSSEFMENLCVLLAFEKCFSQSPVLTGFFFGGMPNVPVSSRQRLFENLRMLPHAPGVQMQAIPEDAVQEDSGDEDEEDPNKRISSNEPLPCSDEKSFWTRSPFYFNPRLLNLQSALMTRG